MSLQLTNDQIKSRVQNIYRAFVTNVDPDDLCDHLIQNKIITIEFRNTIKTKDTKQQQCRELLSHLYSKSNPRTFLVVLEALKTDCEHIYEEIHKQTDTETGGADELSAVHNDDLEQSSSSFQDLMTKLEEERDELRDRVQALEAQLQSGKRKRMEDESDAITIKQNTDTVDLNQSNMVTEGNDFDFEWAHDLVQQFKQAKAESEHENWWKGILEFEWEKLQKSAPSLQWVPIQYRSKYGMKPLIILMKNELNVGTIAPSTDEEASKKKVEKRTKRPTVQIQKWAFLLEDGTPDDKYKSCYYEFISIVSEVFEEEVKQLLEAGSNFVANHDKMDIKSIQPKRMILSLSDMKDLQMKLSPDDFTELESRAILAPNVRIVPLAQQVTKDGVKMTNPLTRICVNFETTCTSRRRPTQLRTKIAEEYAQAVLDGEEVTDENIHKYIRSRCRVTGTIQMNSVCFSDKGISIPVNALHLIVESPKYETPEIDISHLINAIAKS